MKIFLSHEQGCRRERGRSFRARAAGGGLRDRAAAQSPCSRRRTLPSGGASLQCLHTVALRTDGYVFDLCVGKWEIWEYFGLFIV